MLTVGSFTSRQVVLGYMRKLARTCEQAPKQCPPWFLLMVLLEILPWLLIDVDCDLL